MRRPIVATSLDPGRSGFPESGPPSGSSENVDRLLRAWFDEHFAFVWRCLRRLGVQEAEADDASQQVFMVAADHAASISPGGEKAFLFGAVFRVAADYRKARRRDPTVAVPVELVADPKPSAEDLTHGKQMRELLDQVLGELELDARAVFVLFELEELTLAQIAELLAIPQGTVASRLRRARVQFREASKKLQAVLERERGGA